MCVNTKTKEKNPIAFGNAKETKHNKKQITKAFLNAFSQAYKNQKQNTSKTTNKAFLNALIHKNKQKIRQQKPNVPKQTTNNQTKTKKTIP